MIQWLRFQFAMQGTRVQSLVRKLRSHIPRGNEACELQLLSPQATTRESMSRKERSPITQQASCVL